MLEVWERRTQEGHEEEAYISFFFFFFILRFAHENGCRWDSATTYYAARYGHLECLKYVSISYFLVCLILLLADIF